MSSKNNSDFSLLGAVLCGGLSTRMGTDKSQLQRPDGLTQLEYTAQLLQDRVGLTAICGRADQSLPENSNVISILDPIANAGPIAGVLGAVGFANEKNFAATIFVPIDSPSLQLTTIKAMIDAWQHYSDRVVVAANKAGKLQPMFTVVPTCLLDSLQKWVESGGRSLYQWIEKSPHWTVTFEDQLLQNINTSEEWRVWCERYIVAGN